MITEMERSLDTAESYQMNAARIRRSAAQLAVFSQALAEHTDESPLKVAGPAIRDASVELSHSKTYDDARTNLLELSRARESSTARDIQFDWAKLASIRTLMDSMRDRTDQVRKGIRRPKDPASEGLQAAMMSVLALAIDAHADKFENLQERSAWHQSSLSLQKSMTKTAQAMRNKAGESALEHFKAGQDACDQCHERFKR